MVIRIIIRNLITIKEDISNYEKKMYNMQVVIELDTNDNNHIGEIILRNNK